MICSKQAGSFRRPAAILKTIERETAKDKVGVSTNWPPYCLKSSNHVICRLPEISLSRLLSWKPLTEKSLGTRLGLPQTGRHFGKTVTEKPPGRSWRIVDKTLGGQKLKYAHNQKANSAKLAKLLDLEAMLQQRSGSYYFILI